MTAPRSLVALASAVGLLMGVTAVTAGATGPTAPPAAPPQAQAAAPAPTPSMTFGWGLNAEDRVFDGTAVLDRSVNVGLVDSLESGSFQVAFATTATDASTLLALSDTTRDDSHLTLGLDDAGRLTYRVVRAGAVLTDVVSPGAFNDGSPHLVQVAVAGSRVTIDVDASPVLSAAGTAFAAAVPGANSFTFGGRLSASDPVGTDLFTGTIWRVTAYDQPLGSADLAAQAGAKGIPAEAVLPDVGAVRNLLADPDADDTLVFTGDSITHGALWTFGWRSWSEHVDSYLRAEFPGAEHRVVNTAVSGNTARDILEDWTNRVSRWDPAAVTIMIGMNDVVHLGGASGIPTFREQLTEVATTIRTGGAIPIFATSEPIRGGDGGNRAAYSQYVAAVRQVAAEQRVFVVDMYTDWLRRNDGTVPAGWWGDSIHPGGQGHYEFARHFLRSVGLLDPASAFASLSVPPTSAPPVPATSLATELTSSQVGIAPGGTVTMTATVRPGDYPARGVELELTPDPALTVTGALETSPGAEVTQRGDGTYVVRSNSAIAAGSALTVELTATAPAAEHELVSTALATATNTVAAAQPVTLRQAVTTEPAERTRRPAQGRTQTYGWTFADPVLDGTTPVDQSLHISWIEGRREGSIQLYASTTSTGTGTLLSLGSSAHPGDSLAVGMDDGRVTYRVVSGGEVLADVRTESRYNDGNRHLISVGSQDGHLTIFVDAIPVLVEPGRAFVADIADLDRFVIGGLVAGDEVTDPFTGEIRRVSAWNVVLGTGALSSMGIDGATFAPADAAALRTLVDRDSTWLFTGDLGPGVPRTGGARDWVGHLEERQRWERTHRSSFVVDTTETSSTVAELLADYDRRIGDAGAGIVSIVTGAEASDVADYRADLITLIERVRTDGAVPILVLAQAGTDDGHLAAARAVAVTESVLLVDLGTDWLLRNQGHVPASWLGSPGDDPALTGIGAANAAGQYEFARTFGQALQTWDANANTGKIRFAPVSTLTADLTTTAATARSDSPVDLTATVTAGTAPVRDGVITVVTGPGLELTAAPESSLGTVVLGADGSYQVVLPSAVAPSTPVTISASARVDAPAGSVVWAGLEVSLANSAGLTADPRVQVAVVEGGGDEGGGDDGSEGTADADGTSDTGGTDSTDGTDGSDGTDSGTDGADSGTEGTSEIGGASDSDGADAGTDGTSGADDSEGTGGTGPAGSADTGGAGGSDASSDPDDGSASGGTADTGGTGGTGAHGTTDTEGLSATTAGGSGDTGAPAESSAGGASATESDADSGGASAAADDAPEDRDREAGAAAPDAPSQVPPTQLSATGVQVGTVLLLAALTALAGIALAHARRRADG
ncbi:hypothetical protein GCG21_00225 [Pseudactinotalea sp. HY160]|uniref:GDSL-type esterase/lipase family protein n=1 Tax=Pseudactinotalea sp. HY160 TaxID=2654490 RepID=UPI00128B852A|nr:GDSL-type esterase/lipase family protein [Pseudactinotalea sp. HY160]MPV48458.1 hypothetical protein [Pseudactinotalea sp. HY160]